MSWIAWAILIWLLSRREEKELIFVWSFVPIVTLVLGGHPVGVFVAGFWLGNEKRVAWKVFFLSLGVTNLILIGLTFDWASALALLNATFFVLWKAYRSTLAFLGASAIVMGVSLWAFYGPITSVVGTIALGLASLSNQWSFRRALVFRG